MCAPYFVKEHFSVKMLLFFVHLRSQQKRTEKVISSYQIYSVAISTLLFDSSNHKKCSKCPPSASTPANRRRLHSSVAWFTSDWLAQFAPHGDQTLTQLVDVLDYAVVHMLHALFWTFFRFRQFKNYWNLLRFNRVAVKCTLLRFMNHGRNVFCNFSM